MKRERRNNQTIFGLVKVKLRKQKNRKKNRKKNKQKKNAKMLKPAPNIILPIKDAEASYKF